MLRSIINKWDLLKPKSFSYTKDTINSIKLQPKELEKSFTNYTSNKELILKI